MAGIIIELHPAQVPQRLSFEGNFATLTPLNVELHGDDLWHFMQGEAMWTYMAYGPFDTRESFITWLTSVENLTDPLRYTILDKSNGRAVGVFSLMEIKAEQGVIELGHVLFSPTLQRTRIATEAVYLISCYAMDVLGYRRFEWKCDNNNIKSRNAALRFGFTNEGLFRQHRIVKGKNRDTAWFSITDGEWPVRREAFVQWLDDSNFDEQGAQMRSLSDIRASLL